MQEEVYKIHFSIIVNLLEVNFFFRTAFCCYIRVRVYLLIIIYIICMLLPYPPNLLDDRYFLNECKQLLFFKMNLCLHFFVTQNRYEYGEQLCSNCNSYVETAAAGNLSKDKEEEEKIAMNYLLRLMIASSKLGTALKRIEYQT